MTRPLSDTQRAHNQEARMRLAEAVFAYGGTCNEFYMISNGPDGESEPLPQGIDSGHLYGFRMQIGDKQFLISAMEVPSI